MRMKKPVCTILALLAAGISLALSVGWFLNRHSSGDWFEESGFFINLGLAIVALALGISALVRNEPKRILVVVSLLLVTPGCLLCAKIVIGIAGFMFHGDT